VRDEACQATRSVKMNVLLAPNLAKRHSENAELHAETYRGGEEVAELISFMLDVFIEADPSLESLAS
jgi:hypothetical protein